MLRGTCFGRWRGTKGREPAQGSPSLSELPTWLAQAVELSAIATALFALVIPLGATSLAPLLLAAGAMVGLAGGAIFVVNSIRLLKTVLRRLDGRREYELKERGSDLRYVQEVVSAGRREIGRAHPGSEKIQQRIKECREVLRVYVRERSSGRAAFCGYILLYPLKDRAAKAILGGAVRSEAELESEPLDSSLESAGYIYIGMVLGTDRHARSHVRDKLRTELIRVLASGEKLVFARPGTSTGLSLMESYGFVPIGDRQGVWSVEGRRLRQRLLAEEALGSAIIFRASEDRATQRQGEMET